MCVMVWGKKKKKRKKKIYLADASLQVENWRYIICGREVCYLQNFLNNE